MPRLKIRDKGEPREVRLEGPTTIGRVDSCDLKVQDESCSRSHCEVVPQDGGWWLRDLGSSHGTFLNGTRVEESPLSDRDKIRLGATTLEYHESEADATLRFEAGEHEGDVVPVGAGRSTFGRRADNLRSFKDIKVSGVHLEVVMEGEQFVLRDLGSTNGTLLDGRKIDEVILGHGDRVQFGDQIFVFETADGPAVPPPDPAAGPAPSTLKAPAPGRSKATGLIALVVLVLAAGGAAWFAFRGSEEQGGGVARTPPPSPSGNLLSEDWSFEDAGVVAGLWDDRGAASLRPRRAGAVSGAACLAASLDEEEGLAEAWRSPIPVQDARPLALRGRWSADDGVLVSVMVSFQSEEEDAPFHELLLVAAQSTGTAGDWEEFESTVLVPRWASSMALGIEGRGVGELKVDDLALVAGGSATSESVGSLTLFDRGGGAIGLDFGDSLVEGFHAFGTRTDDEGRIQVSSPGAFTLGSRREGSKVRLDFGGPRAPEGASAFLAPQVAADGLDLIAAGGGQRVSGSFEVDGVQALVAGRAAERFELSFDPPCRLSGVPHDRGLWLRIASPGPSLELGFRAKFDEETSEASRLMLEAESEQRKGQLGNALALLREIRDRLPYAVDTLERARTRAVEMVRDAERQMAELDAVYEAATFLDNPARYREVLRRGEELLAKVQGMPITETLEATMQQVRRRVGDLSARRQNEEAAALRNTAQAFGSFEGREGTARRLLQALEESYDTEASSEGDG